MKIEPLVALESNQIGLKRPAQHRGNFGLAHTGGSLQKEWATHFQREEQTHCQPGIHYVALGAQGFVDVFETLESHDACTRLGASRGSVPGGLVTGQDLLETNCNTSHWEVTEPQEQADNLVIRSAGERTLNSVKFP
jgi:hypothetical protein